MSKVLFVPRGTMQENLIFDEVLRVFDGLNNSPESMVFNVDAFQAIFDSCKVQLDIDAMANMASTSPTNDLPMPTQEQLESGDYPKGVISINGITIHIENPKGSIRKGKTWQRTMTHHYGYIDGTMGADGDELDVFVKAGITSLTDKVYVIKQFDKNGVFDEHKLVLGADSLEEAKEIYLSNYDDGWDGLGDIKEINFSELKNKLNKTWGEFDSLNGFSDAKLTQATALQCLKYMAENADGLLSDNKNSDQYRWIDQGYVQGSKKELAQLLKDAKQNGDTVTLNSLDWDLLEAEPRLAESLLKKRNLIGTIDWLSFKDSMDSRTAYFIKKLYAQVASEPLAPMQLISQKNYVNAISNLRQGIESCSNYDDLVKFITQDLWLALKELPPKIMQAYYHANDERKKYIAEKAPPVLSYETQVYSELGQKLYSWIAKSGNYALHEAKTGVNAKNNTVSIGNSWDWAKPKESNTTKPKATRKPKATSVQLETTDEPQRIGGADITVNSSQELKELLNLNAVQSGKYVLNDPKSAEYHMKSTVQAFSDMADVLQMPIHELSLGGNLSIAFGARGRGGALAHYEPSQKVVNITKLRGGGSLGHELFHAIDNIINDLSTQKVGSANFFGSNNHDEMPDQELGQAFKNLVDAMTKAQVFSEKINDIFLKAYQEEFENRLDTKVLLMDTPIDYTQSADNLIENIDSVLSEYLKNVPLKNQKIFLSGGVANTISQICYMRFLYGMKDFFDPSTSTVSIPLESYLGKSNFLKNANRLDGEKGNYWSSNHELSARAFTAYLIDKLAEQGRKNDYLAIEKGDLSFPKGKERQEINLAFDSLFKVIRDKGIFSKAVKNQSLMDDLFSQNMVSPANNIDLNAVTVINQDNAKAVMLKMYVDLMVKQLNQDNADSDNAIFVTDANEPLETYLKRLNTGDIEVNQSTLLHIQNIASTLNGEQLEQAIKTLSNALGAKLLSQDALDIVTYSKTLPVDEQLYFLIASNTYENTVIPHTTKRGKELQGVVLTGLSYADAKAIDKYTFRKDGGFFIRTEYLTEIDDYLLDDNQLLTKEILTYVSNTDSDSPELSAIRGRNGRSSRSNDGRNTNSGMAGQSAQGTNGTGGNGHSGNGVSDDVSSGMASGSNSPDEHGNTRAKTNTSTDDSDTGSTNGSTRSSIEQGRDTHAINDAEKTRNELAERIAKQKQAPSQVKAWADLEDIKATVPILLPEQHQDLVNIEKRLQNDDKNGMLVTNGVGTGKTFTGWGAIKRLVISGKKNILIVVMNDKLLRDFVKAGKSFDLEAYPLKDTKENGKGNTVTITTFNNLGTNKSLFKRKFDAILIDEAHTMMQSADGKVTSALQALRGLTGHHAGFSTWFEEHKKIKKPIDEMTDEEKSQYQENFNQEREKWQERWKAQKNLPKVIFLSATPFSYVTCIDWAEGYLFNYVEPKNQYEANTGGYNSGDSRSNFFVNNFGYRMRYNKLTIPKDREYEGANEREFNENLKNSGAISGRQIKLKFDYDRKFILIDSNIGNTIDGGFHYLSNAKIANNNNHGDNTTSRMYGSLSDYLRKRFNYVTRRQVLESLKANWLIGYIKKQFSLNRKVVVFHDYNDGGAFNPFKIDDSELKRLIEIDSAVITEYEVFKQERKDLVNLSIDFDSAVNIFRSNFSKALFFSGRISKAQRQANVDKFNDDNSGFNLLIVQSDAGSTGISLHDTTGKYQRVSINIGQPIKPAKLRQTEGRIYRVGQASNAIQRYLTTGTDWERQAFVETIAGRAETVDNLAQGRNAKASIKEALITAYNNADYEEPSVNDGIGGKAQEEEAERNLELTPYQNALVYYHKKQEVKTNRNNREGKDWYATPEPLGLKMVHWSGAHSGDRVLEPSAGDGAVMRFAPDGINLTMIEQSPSLASRAQMANTEAKMIVGDFLNDHGTNNKYHSIVMNPPFGNGGADAIKHLAKAFDHLYDLGRLVALVPRGTMDKRIVDWLKETKTAFWVAQIKLPSCTFENAGTGVATQVLIFDKIESMGSLKEQMFLTPKKQEDYSDKQSITDLFSAIDITDIEPRKPRLDESLKSYGLFIDPERSNYMVSGAGLDDKRILMVVRGASFSNRETPNGIIQPYNYSQKILERLVDYEGRYNTSLKIQ